MRVAVLTFQFADNYGAMLQACALKHYLSALGAEVSFIDYTPEQERRFYSLNPFCGKGLRGILKKTLQITERPRIHKRFDEFRKEELGVPSGIAYDPERLARDFDLIVAGSDQIWNKRIVGDVAPYLLKGVPKDCVKASYAASLSVVERSDYESAETLDALKDFDFISVREAGSQRMLSSLGLEVKTVVDPVFLPTASYWKQFGKKPQSVAPDERYAVMYLLRDDADCIERAERYAREQNIILFTVHPLNRRVRSKSAQLIADADPREFVWLIEHADAVFTNSFHATSFSAIFEKKLMYLHQKELGERAADLLGTVRVTPADDDLVTVSCENSTGFTERKAISTEFIDSVFRAAKERENN